MKKKLKIKKGDQVIVRTGRDKGKIGEVIHLIKDADRLVVRGVNMVKRHQKPSQTDAGGVVQKESSIHISNVALVDPKENKATRVGYKTLENGEKVRVAKLSGETIGN